MTGGKKTPFTFYFNIKSKISYNFCADQHTHQKNNYFRKNFCKLITDILKCTFSNLHTKATSCFRSSEIKQMNADAESNSFSL